MSTFDVTQARLIGFRPQLTHFALLGITSHMHKRACKFVSDLFVDGTPVSRGADDMTDPDDGTGLDEHRTTQVDPLPHGGVRGHAHATPTVRHGLDALHRAVFEDMVAHGTPVSQLPIFEQRVSARYAEYHQAAAESDRKLGEAVSRHLTTDPKKRTVNAITERAIAVAHPLRDFLEDVELIEN